MDPAPAGQARRHPTPHRKDGAIAAPVTSRRTPGWFTAEDCRLADFPAIVETTTDLAGYSYADEVRENVLV